MQCPKCNADLPDELIVSEAGKINGRKSRRLLKSEEARRMQKKSVKAYKKNRGMM